MSSPAPDACADEPGPDDATTDDLRQHTSVPHRSSLTRTEPARRPFAATFLPTLVVAACVVLLDQLSKQWALNALDDDHVIEVVWTLRFNLAFNRGMAFSQGTGLGPIIGVIALLVVVALLVSIGRTTSRVYPYAVGLIVGGAVGNLSDRLFREPGWLRGGVVDFIDVQWWPIFNVADIAVTVGGALLILSTLFPASSGAPAS